MMTHNALVRSIHAANPRRLAPRASEIGKTQYDHLSVLIGDLSMNVTALRLNISSAQVQADRNSAALQATDRYNAVKVPKNHHLLLADASFIECWHPIATSVSLEDVLNSNVAALLAQSMLGYSVTCLVIWLQTCPNNQRISRSIAASNICHTTRFIFEERSPCQA